MRGPVNTSTRNYYNNPERQPHLVLHSAPEQVHNNPREIDVDDDHDVELTEKLQLLEIASGLPIRLRGLPEMLDRPDDGEEDGAAADDVNQVEY